MLLLAFLCKQRDNVAGKRFKVSEIERVNEHEHPKLLKKKLLLIQLFNYYFDSF